MANYSTNFVIEQTGLSEGESGFTVSCLENLTVTTHQPDFANVKGLWRVIKAITATRPDFSLTNVALRDGDSLTVEFDLEDRPNPESTLDLMKTVEEWDSDIQGLLENEFKGQPFSLHWTLYGQY